jgi:hypothetical protein
MILNNIMIKYFITNGKKLGITAIEIGNSYIIVEFYSTQNTYSYKICGRSHNETIEKG